MTKEMEFFIYLLEYYAAYKNKRSGEVFEEWEERGIIQMVYDNYWVYHTERIENAFEDIDSLLETGEYAW